MSEPAVEGVQGDTGEATGDQGLTDEENAAAEGQLQNILENDPEELQRQLDHWRKTAQRHEKTARDNSAAATKLRELEDANKTELQKAQDALAQAQRERDAATFASSRMVAAATHDLDPDLIDFLGDGTPDEINSRAETLAGIITKAAAKLAEQNTTSTPPGRQGRSQRPVESMRAGSAPSTTGPGTPDEMFRALINGDSN